MGSVDVGIIIVNYNTRDLLRRCLKTVLASRDVSLRVCVVDNNSGDGSAEMVSAEFPEVTVVYNADNVGYPAANNQGLRLFGYDDDGVSADAPRYALLLNADTELPEDGLCSVVAFADDRADVGVVGPKLVRPDGSLDKACRRSFPTPEVSFYHMVGLSRLFPKSPRFGRYNLSYLDENETVEVDSVVGAFMMVRREAVRDAGLLDDAFFLYGEDLDWAYRMKQVGWRVFYYADVTVLLVKRASSRQNSRARVEFWRSMEIFYRKHYAASTPGPIHALIVAAIRLQTQLTRWRTQLAF
ncbi:MAG: glycosyltransferase family 2 protein [Anaerolineae bacterium]|nr:glycosyltransferase family 2 protein [Anaerolineae bacterium]